MNKRIEFLDSWQNVYAKDYSFIVKFDNHVYKVQTGVEVLGTMKVEELVNYINLFFPELGADYKIIRLS